MKIIFSRKGFDSKYGGGCSPILPDGKLLSIPIPSISLENGIPYSELNTPIGNLHEIVKSLKLKLPENGLSHLDPDIVKSIYIRDKKWRGIFGQAGSASTHLHNNNVESGDIFFFFGSFKRTSFNTDKKLLFSERIPKHIIFGYLIVDKVYNIGCTEITDFKKQHPKLSWSFYHPHLINEKYGKANTIYIAKPNNNGVPGFGAFYYNDNLLLTSPGKTKSIWKLPEYFHYEKGTKISRHGNIARYKKDKGFIELSTVGIGQEFVVSGNDKIYQWATDIITTSKKY